MPLQTAAVFALAKANTLRGSTGEELVPLYTENATPLEFLTARSSSQKVYSRLGGKVVDTTVSGWEGNYTWNGLMHANDMFRAFSAHYGLGTITAEGDAFRDTWTAEGDPLPVILMGRYSTASTSYALVEQAFINNLGLTFNLNGSLAMSLGFYGTKLTLKVATPTIVLPDMTTRLRVSNTTTYQTVVSFTPDTGTLDDFYAKMQTFTFASPRPVSNTGTDGFHYPDFGIPDFSPLGTETCNFTIKDTGGPLSPVLKEYAYATGNVAGTLQASPGTPIEGTLAFTVIGGATVEDITKKYTLSMSGHGLFLGGYAGGIFTGSLAFDDFGTKYLIGDVDAVAQPT